MLVPVSQPKTLPKRLWDKYLWLNVREDEHSAIRWVYTAGKGWVPPSILYRRTSRPVLVLKYQADGLTDQGAYIPLDVAPWEYKLLLQRTLERHKLRGDANDESAKKHAVPQ